MIVLKCTQPTYFDVDDTLVMWDLPDTMKNNLWIDGTYFKVHKPHIEVLKKHAARGHTIIVWSQGGWEWAEKVVKALELEEYVDLVIEKPKWIYDDLPASKFMPESYYLELEED